MLKFFIALFSIVVITLSIPYIDQRCLSSSLIVGRDQYQDLVKWECKTCDESNKPIHAHWIEEKAKDIKCLIAVYDEYTNTAQNVWQDILYPLQIQDQHTCSKCKVQKAYNSMWQSVKKEVMGDLVKMSQATSISTLYITGISLGGGLAAVSYIDINQAKLFRNLNMISFGAPRVGNKDWAAHFDQITKNSTIRYIVKGDPIVVLPKCLTLACNYKHTGSQYVCKQQDKKCYADGDLPDDVSYSERVEERIAYYGKKLLRVNNNNNNEFGGMSDHIDGYPKIYGFAVQSLKNKENKSNQSYQQKQE